MSKFDPNDGKSTEAKSMSVEAFRPEEAAIYARKMVERESRGYGDQANALRSVGRRCGMSAKSMARLIRGERKDPGIRLFAKIRSAYLDHCAALIRQLEAELAADKTRYGDDFVANMESEVSSLVAKLAAERAKLNGRAVSGREAAE